MIRLHKNMSYIARILIVILASTSIIYSQNGISKSYYPDGTPRSQISYVNSVLDGSSLLFYPNGNLKSEKYYSNGILNGVVKEYYETGLVKEEHIIKNGVKDGAQRIYHENGALKELIIFNKGSFVSKQSFEYDPLFSPSAKLYQAGNRQQQLMQEKNIELICDVEICPVPIGGMQAIQNQLVYPEHALLYGMEGTVSLIAMINEKGEVKGTEVIKGLGLGCDEAAQEAVKKTLFIPGQDKGKTVAAKLTINVEFKIFDEPDKLAKDMAAQTPTISAVEKKEIEPKPEETTKTNIYNIASIRCDYEECAYPIYGIKSINKNFEVPSIAKRLKLNGEIIIEANIDKYGIVTDTKVIKGIGYGCDEALQSALLKTKFTPSKQKGESIDSVIKVIYQFNYL